ncbi:MAG: hypothetical protein Q8O07_08510 [Chloroflexota bacterium]|nr:hypothetical protein [Chloroflexota bacterium]
MDAILVDQVTAIYVVLAVAMAIFGGIYAFVWRLGGQAGMGGSNLAAGFAGMVVLWGALGFMALAKVVTAVDLMLVVAAVSVLVALMLVFSALWRLDSATSA